MKKYFSFSVLLLLMLMKGHAQQTNQVNSAAQAQLRAVPQAQASYNATTGGNVLTTSITNRVAPPLGLTTDQKKSFNTALFNFFGEKNNLVKLKWSNPTSYQQQLNTLIQKLSGQLGTFLSDDQVNKFVAMKPPTAQTRDPLILVFY